MTFTNFCVFYDVHFFVSLMSIFGFCGLILKPNGHSLNTDLTL